MSRSKKIFIAGSGDDTEFRKISANIGRLLYREGYEVIITIAHERSEEMYPASAKKDGATDSRTTFDVEVIKGVNTEAMNTDDGHVPENKKRRVHYYESDIYNPFENPNYNGLTFIRKKFNGKRQMVLMNAIKDADCVLLLGGRITTDLVGQLAVLLAKPMIPLSWCGGSGANLWKEYGSKFDIETAAFIDNNVSDVVKDSDSFKTRFPAILKDVIKQNPFAIDTEKRTLTAWKLLSFVLVSFFGWYALYTFGSSRCEELKVLFSFTCIPISVFMGTVLRHGSFGNKRIFSSGSFESYRCILWSSAGILLCWLPGFRKDSWFWGWRF